VESITLTGLEGDPPVVLFMRSQDGGFERRFPTDGLQQGLLLRLGDRDLSGEGVGFGLPVAVLGGRTVFPGSAKVEVEHGGVDGSEWVSVRADYDLCMVERLLLGGKRPISSPRFYRLRERSSAVFRSHKRWRPLLAWACDVLNVIGRVRTDYVESPPVGSVSARMLIHPREGRIDVEVDSSGLRLPGATLACMNELDGRLFDHYQDSEGAALEGEAIGAWDPVEADRAWLRAPDLGLGFGLSAGGEARVFRGREVSDGRFAWSGLACVTSRTGADAPPLAYTLWIERRGARSGNGGL
jgi:hypothetical protein